MARIVLTSLHPLSGKTTVAAGLAAHARSKGVNVSLERSGDDANAAADRALFEVMASGDKSAQLSILEQPAGEPASRSDALTIVVASADVAGSEVSDFGRGALGVVISKVPAKRREMIESSFQSASTRILAVISEDRILGAPSLSQVVGALQAEASNVTNGADSIAIDKPLIASISSDPGQTYFTREDPAAVIVRSDKPDLQLSALNAGARSLIVTGGLPILSYVLDRAEEDSIPLLRTEMDTANTVAAIEDLYGETPFSGGEAKMARLGDLLAGSALLDVIQD